MNINLFTAGRDENGKPSFHKVKTIDMSLIPPIGSFYIHAEENKVYYIKSIVFNDKAIGAIVELQGEGRFDDLKEALC